FLFCFILHFLLKHNTGGHTKKRTRSDTVQAVDKVPRAYMQRNKKKQSIKKASNKRNKKMSNTSNA
ncbi:MAG: hypothetical protein IJC45_09015, partial [Clostridia bacterium]|nr:hypothetical protein [Clostridia bacterium]